MVKRTMFLVLSFLVIAAGLTVLRQAAHARSFGDWAIDQGYMIDAIMPGTVNAYNQSPAIDSLDGIGNYNWIATPTTDLYLYDNQISDIETDDFSRLTNLKTLYLWGNQISSLETGDFSGLANLTELDLYDNQISNIEPGDFSGLTNLTVLDVSGNPISGIETGDFIDVPNLEHLHLYDNEISSIEPGGFNGLGNLTVLDLYGNEVSSIESGDFNDVLDLTHLYLGKNPILSIESGAFNGLALNQAKPSRFAGRFGAVRSARGSSPRGGGRDGSGHGRDFRGWAWRRTGASGLRLQLDGRLTT